MLSDVVDRDWLALISLSQGHVIRQLLSTPACPSIKNETSM